MKTSLDCMPCFMKMALRDSRLACPGDAQKQREIVDAWGAMIGSLDLTLSPPAIARHLTELIENISGTSNWYKLDKLEANERVSTHLPALRRQIEAEHLLTDGDPLSLALEIAIIGNYIDRGVELAFDWESALGNLSRSISQTTLNEFKQAVSDGAKVLILGDNAGEIVLDTLLVQELIHYGAEVTYAVRSKPIINDATMEDAEAVGMTKLCAVVESGVDTPGTVLDRCSTDFITRMREADVILSKGQGNFETLWGEWPSVFCAFKAKCKRVADSAGVELGSSVFCRTPKVK